MDRSGGWTEDEVEFLKTYFPASSTTVVARKLGREFSSVSTKARKLGLKKLVLCEVKDLPSKGRNGGNWIAWTHEETEFIKQFYEDFDTRILCEKLDRSYFAVRGVADNLGLRINKDVRTVSYIKERYKLLESMTFPKKQIVRDDDNYSIKTKKKPKKMNSVDCDHGRIRSGIKEVVFSDLPPGILSITRHRVTLQSENVQQERD